MDGMRCMSNGPGGKNGGGGGYIPSNSPGISRPGGGGGGGWRAGSIMVRSSPFVANPVH